MSAWLIVLKAAHPLPSVLKAAHAQASVLELAHPPPSQLKAAHPLLSHSAHPLLSQMQAAHPLPSVLKAAHAQASVLELAHPLRLHYPPPHTNSFIIGPAGIKHTPPRGNYSTAGLSQTREIEPLSRGGGVRPSPGRPPIERTLMSPVRGSAR